MRQHSAGKEVHYLGLHGITRSCVEAVEGLLHRHHEIETVRLITHDSAHAFLITFIRSDYFVVRAGFSSGYAGEGPGGLSHALSLIESVGLDIDEYEIDRKLFERLNDAKLTWGDLDDIFAIKSVRPLRLYDYIDEHPRNSMDIGRLWSDVEPVIPLAIIDPRIFDLAVRFWKSPDDALMTGYRRLESIVREKTGCDEIGTRLFSQAFNKEDSLLTWDEISENERKGRALLFTGTYMAYRNPRAHSESDHDATEYLRELLMLNQLYTLVASCVLRPSDAKDAKEETGADPVDS